MTDAAVVLINPKTPFNVGTAIRACAIFEVPILRWTGDRIMRAQLRADQGSTAHKDRMPREERMKEYEVVDRGPTPFEYRPFQEFPDYTPVAVEIVEGAEYLDQFTHPEKAVYCFGPEDGDLPER